MPKTFADLGVPAALCAALAEGGITTPFPIQEGLVPDAIAGRDVCGRAPTGSGKTIAFGIPIALRVPKARPGRPTGLVLCPTRELADQVRRELVPLLKPSDRFVASVYGGTGYDAQVRALRRGVDVLVACPGRLEDLIQRRDVSLEDVSIVVVDEADRMADMGFLPAVRRLLDATREDRQTLLLSATLDGEVDVLIRRYQHDPVRVAIETADTDTGDVRHVFWHAHDSERVELTARVVTQCGPTVVFVRTRHGADRLARRLAGEGVGAVAIHGSRTQRQRERALLDFQNGSVATLVATDVAARGIHVDAVSCVVHYDPPADAKDYVHRSGRTGRAGADGTVVSLVGSAQAGAVRRMQTRLGLPGGIHTPDVDNLVAAPPAPAKRVTSTPRANERTERPRRRDRRDRRS